MNNVGRIDECIRRELAPGERVVWSAQPEPAAVFRENAYGLIFSSCWLFFLSPTLFEPDVKEHAGSLAVVFLMLAGGVWMLVGVIAECLSAKRTHYALTDRRLIVARSGWRGRVQAVRIEQLKAAEKVGSNPDRGTIQIPLPMAGGAGKEQNMDYLKLLGIPEPGKVLHLLTR